MTIRVEKDPMGMGGRAWYITSPADLAKLPREAASLVSPHLADLFRDLPRSLERLAAQAPLPSMRRWLTSLTDAPCVLEVYATRHFGREARLRFHVAPTWSPSFRGVAGPPATPCPAILQQVHALTGHIDYQFGCSGTLVALDELQTIPALVADQKVMGFEDLATLLESRPELRAYIGFYEADGDWLCCDAEGRTLWTGGEWLDAPIVASPLDITATLDRYFEALTAKTYFRPDP